MTDEIRRELARLREENEAMKRVGLHKTKGTGLPEGTVVILPDGTHARVAADGLFDEDSIGKGGLVDMGNGVMFITADAAARLDFHGTTGQGEAPAAGSQTVNKALRKLVAKAHANPNRLPNSSAPIPGGGLGGRFFT